MSRRSWFWFTLAALFTLVNLVGAGYAAVLHEGEHATIHALLTVVGAFLVWLIAASAARRARAAALAGDPRLDELQRSVDAVAYEVERLGEAQRYAAKRQQEHDKDQH